MMTSTTMTTRSLFLAGLLLLVVPAALCETADDDDGGATCDDGSSKTATASCKAAPGGQDAEEDSATMMLQLRSNGKVNTEKSEDQVELGSATEETCKQCKDHGMKYQCCGNGQCGCSSKKIGCASFTNCDNYLLVQEDSKEDSESKGDQLESTGSGNCMTQCTRGCNAHSGVYGKCLTACQKKCSTSRAPQDNTPKDMGSTECTGTTGASTDMGGGYGGYHQDYVIPNCHHEQYWCQTSFNPARFGCTDSTLGCLKYWHCEY